MYFLIVLLSIELLIGICYVVYLFIKEYNRQKEYKKHVENNYKFMKIVPKRYHKNIFEAFENRAMYDSNGYMIWNSVQGCVGPSTYVSNENNTSEWKKNIKRKHEKTREYIREHFRWDEDARITSAAYSLYFSTIIDS